MFLFLSCRICIASLSVVLFFFFFLYWDLLHLSWGLSGFGVKFGVGFEMVSSGIPLGMLLLLTTS